MLFSTSLSHAAIDFDNYVATLDELHAEDSNIIPSGYDKTTVFSAANQGAFAYHTVDNDGNITTTYYTINTPNQASDINSALLFDDISEAIVNTTNTPLREGYFWEINGAAYGGTFENRAGIEIENIYADFVGNTLSSFGGVLLNAGTIGTINGDFIKNSSPKGAIYNYSGTITTINGNFIGNTANGHGGAIYNDSGTITTINGDFIGNNSGSLSNWGGAIYNDRGTITTINGDFIGNNASSYGGAIRNDGIITTIIGDFIGNRNASGGWGGAIYNLRTITTIKGNFIGNIADMNGGAIYNDAGSTDVLNLIEGDFVGNSAGNTGGAIQNGQRTITTINGDFIGNSADFAGGAIYNTLGTIGTINGDFIRSNSGTGGAIYNYSGTITTINGDFTGNSAEMLGGAIYNDGTIGSISGSFRNNYVAADSSSIHGGAIYSYSSLNFVADNRNNYFSGNYVEDSIGRKNNAIFLQVPTSGGDPKELNFEMTNGGAFIFDDTIETGRLSSGVDYSVRGNLNITGDIIDGKVNGNFFLRNDLINIGEVNVENAMLIFGKFEVDGNKPESIGRILPALNPDGTPNLTSPAVTSISLNNAELNLYNGYTENVYLKNFAGDGGSLLAPAAATESILHLDVKRVGAGQWEADKLIIGGDITGKTSLIVYSLQSNSDFTSTVFVEAPNDTKKLDDAFVIKRVYGNPYIFAAARNINGNEEGSVWYLIPDGNNDPEDANTLPPVIKPGVIPEIPEEPETPGPQPIEVQPEILDFRGLHAAGIEQTRSMVWNIKSKVAANKVLADPCADVIDAYIGNNVWANPVYFTSTIKAPVHMEADIWGLEAGFDIQHDVNNKLGVFVSYRKGEYDLDGRGERYYADIGSKIDIDSYIAGLYYRYDYRHLWAFATLYGGIQKADIKTDDGVIDTDTDGAQFGGSAEVGYTYALKQDLNLEPSLGVSYTEIDWDDLDDSVGKTASYHKISQWEIEAALKLEKQIATDHGLAKVYIKPSVIQPITNGDSVTITGLGKVNTYDDETLGRVEVGGRYALTDRLSTYGFINYTFGDNYEATSLGAGLNYAW